MAAALVKGSEKKFGATEDFFPPAIQIVPLPLAKSIHCRRFFAR